MKESLTHEQITKNPGVLPSKMIFDMLAANDYNIWMIGHMNGALLYHIRLSQETNATVTFTSPDIAQAYVNNNAIRKNVLKNFGKKFVLVGTTLMHLQNMINPVNLSFMSNVVINPLASGEFFIPLPLPYIAKLIEDGILDYDEEDDGDIDLIEMIYDRESKRFIPDEEENVIF